MIVTFTTGERATNSAAKEAVIAGTTRELV